MHTVLEQSNGLAWEVITGRVFDNKVERLDGLDDKQRAAVELCRIHGIGKVKADKYIQAGLRSLVDVLKECQKKDRKVDIPVGCSRFRRERISMIDDGVLNSTRYTSERTTWMTSSSLFRECELPFLAFASIGTFCTGIDSELNDVFRESIEWQKILDAACEKADKNLKGYILGSYRRESPYSSDIDYVLYHPDIKMDSKESECKRMMSKFVEQIDEPYVVGQLSFGDKQFQGIIRMSPTSVARRIDINLGTADHFGCKMLASTGDDRLQKIIRGKAKDMNLFLNDIAIGPRVPHHSGTASHFKKDELIETPEEKDIFKLLELPWLEPKQRNFGYYSKLPEYRALIDKGY